ncbi:MAG: hypothetical protein ACKVIQ_07590 [Acidimicrobiales bacterium]
MSVDTNTKGKNLAPYRTMRHEEYKILMAPKLIGLATAMRVDVKGGLRKRLVVELDDGTGGACDI